MSTVEANFDGLVGPTHHYAGLSKGNEASKANALTVANPKAAALQGLAKMKHLADLGFVQGLLPPHPRPNLTLLRELGFGGEDDQVLAAAWASSPEVAGKCYSAAAMWTANAATVSPSADTPDRKVHFTPANLSAMFHRAFEHPFTGHALQQIFASDAHFTHHPALPSGAYFGDEGAANHTRLAPDHGSPGVHLFVYGADGFGRGPAPALYPARQSLQASQAVARQHGLAPSQVVYAQQHPEVIDQGVFHNDVIAVGSANALFYHAEAFLDRDATIAALRSAYGDGLHLIEVPADRVSVADAVSTYLFNTQLLHRVADDFLLLAPTECEEHEGVSAYLSDVVQSDAPINEVVYLDLRESMKNGGGPACLRLRVALTEAELDAVSGRVLMDDALYADLTAWVNEHYRDRLTFEDLQEPALLPEVSRALSALGDLLELPQLYAGLR